MSPCWWGMSIAMPVVAVVVRVCPWPGWLSSLWLEYVHIGVEVFVTVVVGVCPWRCRLSPWWLGCVHMPAVVAGPEGDRPTAEHRGLRQRSQGGEPQQESGHHDATASVLLSSPPLMGLSLCLSVSLSVSARLSVFLSLCLSVSVSARLSVFLSLCPSLGLGLCMLSLIHI